MSRESFQNILKRYLEGNCTDEEKRMVEQWYAMLDDEEDIAEVSSAELAELDERLWNVVQERVNTTAPIVEKEVFITEDPQPIVSNLWTKVTIAASLIGFLLSATYLVLQQPNTSEFLSSHTPNSLIKKVNDTDKAMELMLEDGSVVRLQPNAELTYPKHFASTKREVFLQGEAFFEVSKNKKRPFYVHSTNLLTQVVGTSFVVRDTEQGMASEVAVLTGKVIVSKNESSTPFYQHLPWQKADQAVLTPNQRVIYEQDSQELKITLVEDPLPVVSAQEEISFDFNEASVATVLASLEKTYGIQIQSSNQSIYQCTFTGDLANQSLHERLEIICQTIGASYQVKGASIFIQGGNCQ